MRGFKKAKRENSVEQQIYPATQISKYGNSMPTGGLKCKKKTVYEDRHEEEDTRSLKTIVQTNSFINKKIK